MSEQLRVQIAEWCGWLCICADNPMGSPSTGPCGVRAQYKGRESTEFFEPLPDYCGDLNAIHEAEKRLTIDQSTAYVNLLWPQGYAPFQAVHATALQRATALARVINQERE